MSVPPPVSLYELVRGRRWSNTVYDHHQDFSGGMVQDIPPYLLMEGQSFDLQDVLLDQRGKARLRGGDWTPYAGSAYNALANQIAAYRSGAADGTVNLYVAAYGPNGGPTFSVWAVSLVSFVHGLAYSSAQQSLTSGRPVQYGNHLVFPVTAFGAGGGGGFPSPQVIGGVSGGAPTYAALTAATVTAGSNDITAIGPAMGTTPFAGEYLAVSDATHTFISRIVQGLSGTSVRVENTPPVSFVATSGTVTPKYAVGVPSDGSNPFQGLTGAFAAVWQNRLILASCYLTPPFVSAATQQLARRLYWSVLPNEAPVAVAASGTTYYGDPILCVGAFSSTNWIEIPGNEPIRGVSPMGEGEFVVFGVTKTYRMRGTLQTQTGTTPSASSISLGEIPNSVGCLEPMSISRSPRGILFASYDGVYVYDGASMTNLMQNRLQTYYINRLATGDLVVGGYLVRNRWYVVSMTGNDGSLMLDLITLGWVRLASDSKFFDAVPWPFATGGTSGASQTFVGLKWWDVLSAPPSFVHGDTFFLDQWFTNQGGLDFSNNAAPRFSLTTRLIPESGTADFKRFTRLYLELDYRSIGGTVTVEATTDVTIDSFTSWTSLGTISPGNPATSSASSVVSMLPINMRGQGIAFRLTATTLPTGRLEVISAKIAYQPMREPRAVA